MKVLYCQHPHTTSPEDVFDWYVQTEWHLAASGSPPDVCAVWLDSFADYGLYNAISHLRGTP